MHNPNTFDLNLLRVFDALLREGSVSAAANRVGLSQPAVSNALQRLRMILGDPLFVRTRRGMEPTAFALRLCDPVQQGLSQIRSGLSQVVTFDPMTSERTFTLLMNDVGAAAFLPEVMRKLALAAPRVNMRVTELDHADYEDSLDRGEADLAIGRVMLSSSFCSEYLVKSVYVAVLRSDHPALRRRRGVRPELTEEAYVSAPHVIVSPRGATGNLVERALYQRRPDPRIVLDVPHATSLMNILPGTDLVATVPDRCVAFLCRDRRLTWAHIPISLEPNMVYQWWHKRQDYDAGHRWLRSFTAEAIRIDTR
ncbi:LysR family transcriptional regulator [Georhizobium profundi]|jgi:DNA-binding transcriptional LysR family regulator|uniref:LysR family transcriptional regulator n=1 Tax=Georhizobium profundi TaxID=2341112 RepID=A0A3Q8XLQ7_9HYPH|nr:LysR family transcriptional regulator [Georhizobium profundi]AZN70506.1 LysR family transcriptional regulator [Georhizobium profundi]